MITSLHDDVTEMSDWTPDRRLVWAKAKGRTWNKKQQTKTRKKRDYKVLKDDVTRKKFGENFGTKLGNNATWTTFQTAITEVIDELCPKVEEKKKS